LKLDLMFMVQTALSQPATHFLGSLASVTAGSHMRT
jgi:hypothetical protein